MGSGVSQKLASSVWAYRLQHQQLWGQTHSEEQPLYAVVLLILPVSGFTELLSSVGKHEPPRLTNRKKRQQEPVPRRDQLGAFRGT